MVVSKKTQKVICTDFSNGKRHDFRLFKESRTYIHPESNRKLASQRVLNENVIGMLKRFKIIVDRYRNRNRKKRFGLRFNIIAGIYNWELK